MDTLDDILGAFEEALELERELGTRTVECDRALLTPLRPVEGDGGSRGARTPTASVTVVQSPKPVVQSPKSEVQSPKSEVQSPKSEVQSPKSEVQSPLTDFAFIVAEAPQGAARDLLVKMVAAMGYAMNQVTVVTAASAVAARPRAKVYVVLGGRDAFRAFAPGRHAALGLWTEVAGVPTIVTYSPARILTYFGNDVAGLTKAKRQIWNDLKSALARIGKNPPRS